MTRFAQRFRSFPAWHWAGAAATAVLTALAYPPVEWSDAAWFGLVPLLIVARYSAPRDAFRYGWFSGLLFWLITLSWLLRLAVTGTNIVAAGAAWIALAAACAVYWGAFAMALSGLCRWVGTERRWLNAVLFPGIPVLWVGFEYLRSTLFTGFPWNTLAISQFRNLVIIQLAEWGGVYAVSGLLMVVNAAIMLTLLSFAFIVFQKKRYTLHVAFMLGVVTLALSIFHGRDALKAHSTDAAGGASPRIAVIQPAIPQVKKWTEGFENFIYQRLKEQTRLAAAARPDLVIWPETCVPAVLRTDPVAEDFVTGMAQTCGPLLAGVMDGERVEGRDRYTNKSILVGATGRVLQEYTKRHLVLFGEYLPFDKTLTFLQNFVPLGCSCWPGTESTVFRLEKPEVPFAAMICFEDIFAYVARDAVRAGARLLVNQTNDAWFDGSCGALQHMAHSVFRSVENRVAVVRSANTGVSCFIHRTGEVEFLESSGGGGGGAGFAVSSVSVPASDRPPTFYTRYGDRPFALPCGVLAACWLAAVVALERRRFFDRPPAGGSEKDRKETTEEDREGAPERAPVNTADTERTQR